MCSSLPYIIFEYFLKSQSQSPTFQCDLEFQIYLWHVVFLNFYDLLYFPVFLNYIDQIVKWLININYNKLNKNCYALQNEVLRHSCLFVNFFFLEPLHQNNNSN